MSLALYEQYGRALLRKAERVLQNRPDAEDVVQGLFLHLLQNPKPGTDMDLSYLYQATTHHCLNFIRDRRNRARLLENQDESVRGPVRTPCEDRVVSLDLLFKLTAVLDDKCSGVLVLYYFDDLSQEEVARVSGLSRKTVGRYLEKIRAAVQHLTQEETAHA